MGVDCTAAVLECDWVGWTFKLVVAFTVIWTGALVEDCLIAPKIEIDCAGTDSTTDSETVSGLRYTEAE